MRLIAFAEADFDKVPKAQGVRGERSCLFYGGAEMTKDLIGILARGSFKRKSKQNQIKQKTLYLWHKSFPTVCMNKVKY